MGEFLDIGDIYHATKGSFWRDTVSNGNCNQFKGKEAPTARQGPPAPEMCHPDKSYPSNVFTNLIDIHLHSSKHTIFSHTQHSNKTPHILKSSLQSLQNSVPGQNTGPSNFQKGLGTDSTTLPHFVGSNGDSLENFGGAIPVRCTKLVERYI